MLEIHDLRTRVMSMESTDCRNELSDTLDLLDSLEHDFRILCREVMRQSCGENEIPMVSGEFIAMFNNRDIVNPL